VPSHATVFTAAIVWVAASYAIALLLAADQMRRPLSTWEAAGRNRRVWVALSLAFGFHGLGEYVAAAYVISVVPRFGDPERSRVVQALRRTNAAVMPRWHRIAVRLPAPRADNQLEATVLVASVLTFVSSVIHAAEISSHLEQYWLFGLLFALAACLQALWMASVWREPLNGRLLVLGALLNIGLIVAWAISRTTGLPFGPGAGQPEPVGVIDVISKMDELAAVILVSLVFWRLRSGRGVQLSPTQVRLATALAGPLIIYSVLAAIGGGHHHH
jgi:hypothetical protein